MASRLQSEVRWIPFENFGTTRHAPCLGRCSPINPPNFTFLWPAVQEFITTIPFWHLLICPHVDSYHMALTDSSAKYEPHTFPLSKVINLPITLPSQYHSTSLIRFSEKPRGFRSLQRQAWMMSVTTYFKISGCPITAPIGQDNNSGNFSQKLLTAQALAPFWRSHQRTHMLSRAQSQTTTIFAAKIAPNPDDLNSIKNKLKSCILNVNHSGRSISKQI